MIVIQQCRETSTARRTGRREQTGGEPVQQVVMTLRMRGIHDAARTQRDVLFHLALGAVDVLRQAGHFENGFFVTRRSDYVCVRRLLYTLYSGTLGSDDQTHHSVGDANLFGHVTGCCRGWRTQR